MGNTLDVTCEGGGQSHKRLGGPNLSVPSGYGPFYFNFSENFQVEFSCTTADYLLCPIESTDVRFKREHGLGEGLGGVRTYSATADRGRTFAYPGSTSYATPFS